MDKPAPQLTAADDALGRWAPRVLTAVVVGLVVARVWIVFYRLLDPDELEHLHAGFCVWQGAVPYRDFFEQHGPILWYASLPLFAIWGASLKVLFAGRLIIWAVGAATIALTWRLGKRLYGRWGGPIAALWLVLLPPFQEKHIEWRPDNVAALLVLLALVWLGQTDGRRGWLWAAIGGAALSAAFFSTQKIVYVGFGMVLGVVCTVLAEARNGRAQPASAKAPLAQRLRSERDCPDATLPQRGRGTWSRLLAMVIGAWAVACGVFAFFHSQGALSEYFNMTVLLPMKWKTREPVMPCLVATLGSAPIFWGAFASGVLLSLSDARQSAARQAGTLVLTGGALGHALGLLVVPAAFHQYYVPLAPLGALLAARAVTGPAGLLTSGAVTARSGRGTRLLATVVGVSVFAIGLRCRFLFTFPHVAWTVTLVTGLVVSVAMGIAGARRLATLLLLCAGAVGAAPFLWPHFRVGHAGQTHCIEQLLEATSPEDRFLDGFTGYGALRPHAFSYYWINDHSWPMLPASQKVAGVLEALADPRTRVVLYDDYLRRLLPPVVTHYLEQNFVPDARYRCPACFVLVKRGRELPPPTVGTGSGAASRGTRRHLAVATALCPQVRSFKPWRTKVTPASEQALKTTSSISPGSCLARSAAATGRPTNRCATRRSPRSSRERAGSSSKDSSSTASTSSGAGTWASTQARSVRRTCACSATTQRSSASAARSACGLKRHCAHQSFRRDRVWQRRDGTWRHVHFHRSVGG